MLEIRRSRDRIIFNMGSPYLGMTVFILRRGLEFRFKDDHKSLFFKFCDGIDFTVKR